MDRIPLKKFNFSIENEANLYKKEFSISMHPNKEVKMSELLGLFKQFLIALSYDEDTIKRLVFVDEADLENIGIDKKDLTIYDWDDILS